MRLLFFLLVALPACAQISPFGFEANDGNLPADVRFIRRSTTTSLTLTGDSLVLFNGIRIQIANVPPSITPAGAVPTTTLYNYYLGNDPSRWRTGFRLFSQVVWRDISPGLSAIFDNSIERTASLFGFRPARFALRLTAAPGANLSAFRFNVLNTGTSAFVGPGGDIWFAGGNVSVFPLIATILQRRGEEIISIQGGLKIESAETLSIDTSNLNPALPTEVEITFPTYDNSSLGLPPPSSDGNRYREGLVSRVPNVGADGSQIQDCGFQCYNATLARLDGESKPLWVTVYGGVSGESSSLPVPIPAGVAMAGSTSSPDFPTTANAPFKQLRGPGDAYVALFDRETGRLKTASFGGLDGSAYVQVALPTAANDLLFGGAITGNPESGFLLRWQMDENRMLFTRRFPARVSALAIDSRARILYAVQKFTSLPAQLTTGALDATGKDDGIVAVISAPGTSTFFDPKLFSLPGTDYLLTYTNQFSTLQGVSSGRPRLLAAKFSTLSATPLWTRSLGLLTWQVQVGLTPQDNLKFQSSNQQPDSPTTINAELVAKCPDTDYFQILSPSGDLLYASYVPPGGPDFAQRNEPAHAPAPRLNCVAATAGRQPFQAIAPGQLITLTGAGFGPTTAHYATPDANGKYPLELSGFRARIAGLDAPVIAVARGLLTVQVPFETPTNVSNVRIEMMDAGRPLNPINVSASPLVFSLFDSGELNSTLGFPQLAALNQDGTINGPDNPASADSVISLFGSGLGLLTPPLQTGGLNPAPPEAPLSTTQLIRVALGGTIEYLGSAPGLSSAVVQVNLRLPANFPSGVRFHGIGVGVGRTPGQAFIGSPSGVIYVR